MSTWYEYNKEQKVYTWMRMGIGHVSRPFHRFLIKRRVLKYRVIKLLSDFCLYLQGPYRVQEFAWREYSDSFLCARY